MEIINLPFSNIIKCEDCGTVFSFDAHDVTVIRELSFEESKRVLLDLHINCPLCDKEYSLMDKIKKEDKDE